MEWKRWMQISGRVNSIIWIFVSVPVLLHLLDVEEVLGIKGDAGAGHRDVLIESSAVADVGPHSEGYSFSLEESRQQKSKDSNENKRTARICRQTPTESRGDKHTCGYYMVFTAVCLCVDSLR